ncbi:hypothetical protein B6U99_04235 [Candidatus Geothermarchaeota archaeon ex4572_27]|nr:MAG: hypothetical protein B6U99_04235 [Candidatus Geothermarchaeota archaeon ex4572_27]
MIAERIQDPQLRDRMCRLFNTLKNSRRLAILKLLSRRPMGLKDLQRGLWSMGLRHSLETIVDAYLKPLIEVGVVRLGGGRAELTPMGRRVAEDALRESWVFERLPARSRCHEEALLISLLEGPRRVSSLNIAPQAVMYRAINRLRGLVKATGREAIYVALDGDEGSLSPTERRLFRAIMDKGGVVPLREIMRERFISRRRVYKYLARLRVKGFIDRILQEPEVELTEEGVKAAKVLWRVASYASFDVEKPKLKELLVSYLSQLSRQAFDEDMVEHLNKYFRSVYYRPIQPYEFDELKDELKREGVIEGNPYAGYRLVK